MEEMLLEYFQAAQEGSVPVETLDELICTLEEMHEYHLAGKLIIPGEKDLAEMRKSITAYTAMVSEKEYGKRFQFSETPEGDEFFLIREQLIMQKKMIGEKDRN